MAETPVKTAILLLADGAEEMEAIITADVLRRAGIQVTIASISDSKCIKCSRDVKICTDEKLEDVKNRNYDAIILPGGMGGSEALAGSSQVGEILKKQESNNGVIAAICAAPTVLKAHGVAKGKKITSYPSLKDQFEGQDYTYIDEDIVVIDGNIITSKGPATSFAFGLAIAEKLMNKEIAKTVAKAMLYEYE